MNNFDQTAIETAVGEVLRDLGVSENIFHNRPRSSSVNLSDFVVCNVAGEIKDMAAFGICTVNVHLFARDSANMKNGKRLSVMQGKIKEGMTGALGDMCLDIHGVNPLGDMSDRNGYHVRIIQLKQVIIKIA